MAIPASVGLILVREPLISFLFKRGKFDEHDVQLTAWALLWYAAGIVGHSAMEILTRAFYAQHDTKTPVLIGTIAMALNVIFSIAFAKAFESIGWMPHGGLALANSFATALEAIVLFIFMRKRLNGIEGSHILRGAIPSTLAALTMGISLIGWLHYGKTLPNWVLLPAGVILGGGVYAVMLWLLRVPEVTYMTSSVLRRLKR
jgi:putative peptidoglycan lipid II flippase